jgi:hypothetical protein
MKIQYQVIKMEFFLFMEDLLLKPSFIVYELVIYLEVMEKYL